MPSPPILQRPRRDEVEQRRLRLLKRAVRRLGKVLDRRTALGRTLAEWRDSLVADLGGDLTTQQMTLVDACVRTRLLLETVDAYVLGEMGSPVNRKRRCLHPVVRERQALVAQLQSLLRDLGLERRQKPVTDLASYLA